MNQRIKMKRTTVLIAILLAGVVFILTEYGLISNRMIGLSNDSRLSLFTTQLSLTFITISVLSVLSDNSVVILWENIIEKRLIEPVYTCFDALTWYTIVTVMLSVVAMAMNSNVLFIISFSINVIVLAILTLTMIDVYYDRQNKREKLEKQFEEVAKPYFKGKTKLETTELYAKKEDVYSKYLRGLRQQTLHAVANSNFSLLEENYNFYGKYYRYLSAKEFRFIMGTVSANTFSLIHFMMEDIVSNEEAYIQTYLNQLQKRKAITDDDQMYFVFGSEEMWLEAIRSRDFMRVLEEEGDYAMRKFGYLMKCHFIMVYQYFLVKYFIMNSDMEIDGKKISFEEAWMELDEEYCNLRNGKRMGDCANAEEEQELRYQIIREVLKKNDLELNHSSDNNFMDYFKEALNDMVMNNKPESLLIYLTEDFKDFPMFNYLLVGKNKNAFSYSVRCSEK